MLSTRALCLRHVEQRLRVVRVLNTERRRLLLGGGGVRFIRPRVVTPREFASPEVVRGCRGGGVPGPVVFLQRPRGVRVQPLGFVPSPLEAVELREVVPRGCDVRVVFAESCDRFFERPAEVLASLFVLAPTR